MSKPDSSGNRTGLLDSLAALLPWRRGIPKPSTTLNIAASGGPVSPSTPWNYLHSRRAGFRIEIPGESVDEAQWTSNLPGEPTLYQFQSNWDGFSYSATCYLYRTGDSEEIALLMAENERNELASGKFQVVWEEKALVAGLKGQQYELLYRNGARCIRRSVSVANRVFHLDVSFGPRRAGEALNDYMRFFLSLSLSEPESEESEADLPVV